MDKEELLERYEADGDEGVYAEAKQLYEQALSGDGGDAHTLSEFGYLQECHGRRAIRAAIDSYQRAIDADPHWPKPHRQLIYALAALGETGQAIDRYRQRLTDAPNDPHAYSLLAAAYLHAHDFSHADQIITTGLDLAPSDPTLIELRGDLHAAAGRPDDALTLWRQAFTLDPDNLSPRYSAALLLEHQDRLAEAAQEWQFIIDWCDERGHTATAEWPRTELRRLRGRLSDR